MITTAAAKPRPTREPTPEEVDHCNALRVLWNESREAFESTPLEHGFERIRRHKASERARAAYFDRVDALHLEVVASGK